MFTTTLIALEVAGEPDIHDAILEPISTVIVTLLDNVDVVYVELVAPAIMLPLDFH